MSDIDIVEWRRLDMIERGPQAVEGVAIGLRRDAVQASTVRRPEVPIAE